MFYFKQDEDVEQPPLIAPGSYVRVYGTLKSFQGSPHIVINRIHEIKDPNEITMHLLEMTHTYLRMKNVSFCTNNLFNICICIYVMLLLSTQVIITYSCWVSNIKKD